MKKFLAILLITLSISGITYAQHSPFKPIHINTPLKLNFGASTTTDSVFGAWRFVGSIAGYTVPGKTLLTGAGFGYQVLDYNYTTQRVTSKFSLSAMMWATGNTAPSSPATAASFGVLAGVFNNLIQIGYAYNTGVKGQFVLALGVGFNN